MKRLMFSGVVGMMMLLIVSGSLYGAESAQVANDHLTLAAVYEEKAAAQDALIAEHVKMKLEYKDRFFINEKVTPLDKVRAMEKHCDAIIESAQKQKSELLEFAKWHRMSAAELQGM